MKSPAIAVIPARGGSKRIPRKNIRSFHGKPMIAWSIEAAQASGCFDRIVVSTDDAEIAAVAVQWGAECPFVRPGALADDHATTTAVISLAVGRVCESGDSPAAVCCIYATAPFIGPDDLRRGLEILRSGGWRYVFAATTFGHPIFRGFEHTAGGGVRMFFPEHAGTRSQDLPEAHHDAGMFYWGLPEAWLAGDPIFDSRSTIVPLPRWRVQDIDTEEDWQRADRMAAALGRRAA